MNPPEYAILGEVRPVKLLAGTHLFQSPTVKSISLPLSSHTWIPKTLNYWGLLSSLLNCSPPQPFAMKLLTATARKTEWLGPRPHNTIHFWCFLDILKKTLFFSPKFQPTGDWTNKNDGKKTFKKSAHRIHLKRAAPGISKKRICGTTFLNTPRYLPFPKRGNLFHNQKIADGSDEFWLWPFWAIRFPKKNFFPKRSMDSGPGKPWCFPHHPLK